MHFHKLGENNNILKLFIICITLFIFYFHLPPFPHFTTSAIHFSFQANGLLNVTILQSNKTAGTLLIRIGRLVRPLLCVVNDQLTSFFLAVTIPRPFSHFTKSILTANACSLYVYYTLVRETLSRVLAGILFLPVSIIIIAKKL